MHGWQYKKKDARKHTAHDIIHSWALTQKYVDNESADWCANAKARNLDLGDAMRACTCFT